MLFLDELCWSIFNVINSRMSHCYSVTAECSNELIDKMTRNKLFKIISVLKSVEKNQNLKIIYLNFTSTRISFHLRQNTF